MTQAEADRELGRVVREAFENAAADGRGREVDVAIDVPGVGYVLARVHVDLADKYI